MRSYLSALLGEQAYLTWLAGNALLRGDAAASQAWQTELSGHPTACSYGSCFHNPQPPPLANLAAVSPRGIDNSNSGDLGSTISFAFGATAGQVFAQLWASPDHIPAVLGYAQELATGNAAGTKAPKEAITRFAGNLARTVHALAPDLTVPVVERAGIAQASALVGALDAQHRGAPTTAYREVDIAYHSLDGLALPLAAAAAAKFPTRFEGNANSPASILEARLTSRMQEHILLTASAAAATLAGRREDADGASAEIGDNSNGLAEAVRSVYGAQAGAQFQTVWEESAPIWIQHQAAFASGDGAAIQSADTKLNTWLTLLAYVVKGFNPALDPGSANGTALANEYGRLTSVGTVIQAQIDQNPASIAAAQRFADAAALPAGQVFAQGAVLKFPALLPGPRSALPILLLGLGLLLAGVGFLTRRRTTKQVVEGIRNASRWPGREGKECSRQRPWQWRGAGRS